MTGQFDGRRHCMEPGAAPLPYVGGGKRTLIFGSVSLFHIGLILVPFLLYSLSSLIDPPVSVTKVSLVDSPPNDNERPSRFPDPKRADPVGTPDYGDPGPISDIPDVPDPAPEPEPAPAKAEPVKTEPVPEPVKTEPKAVPEVKVPPKPKPVKPKPKWKSAAEIRKSTKFVRRGTGKRSPARRSSDSRRQDIRNILKNWASETGGTGSPNASRYGMRGGRGLAGGGGGPVGVLDRDLIAYYDKVAAYLKRQWNQPNQAALGGTMPKVEIRLKIDSAGRVLSANIFRRSGNRAMDASVEELIGKLKVLPNPPKAMEFAVTMEIDSL